MRLAARVQPRRQRRRSRAFHAMHSSASCLACASRRLMPGSFLSPKKRERVGDQLGVAEAADGADDARSACSRAPCAASSPPARLDERSTPRAATTDGRSDVRDQARHVLRAHLGRRATAPASAPTSAGAWKIGQRAQEAVALLGRGRRHHARAIGLPARRIAAARRQTARRCRPSVGVDALAVGQVARELAARRRERRGTSASPSVSHSDARSWRASTDSPSLRRPAELVERAAEHLVDEAAPALAIARRHELVTDAREAPPHLGDDVVVRLAAQLARRARGTTRAARARRAPAPRRRRRGRALDRLQALARPRARAPPASPPS